MPVNTITQVKVDGSPLVTGGYRVDDNRRLVRLGGTWPRCNDLNKDDTQIGTWSVTATYGEDVPEGGKWAVGELACELIRAFKGEECRLPRTVTSLARQGVSIQFPDVASLFEKGRTGLYLVDLFISAWNPHNATRRARTFNVDQSSARRVGT